METTIDKFGRVVIPKELRDELGLTLGSTLRIDSEGGCILLGAVEQRSCLAKRNGRLVCVGDLTESINVDGLVRRTREARTRKLTSEAEE